jgi:hypothetical protein
MRLQVTKLEHAGKFDFEPVEASDIRQSLHTPAA